MQDGTAMPSGRASRWHLLGDVFSTVTVDRCRAYPLPDLLPCGYRLRPTLSWAVQVWTPPAGHELTGHAPGSDHPCLASTINQQIDITRAWNALEQGLNSLSTTPQFSRVLPTSRGWFSLHIDGFMGHEGGPTRPDQGFRRGRYRVPYDGLMAVSLQ